MKQTFKLKKGKILFEQDKIIIKDDAKEQKWVWTFILCLGTISSVLTFLKYLKSDDKFEFWFSLTIGLSSILILTIWLLRLVISEISLDEVKSMKFKQRNRNKFLHIKLNNNRVRRIVLVDNATELEEYIKTNLKTKLNYGC
ncbi:MAG: hypothetical protein JJE55_15905 [Flavobacteriaceae bacterium]|nr:hypothetical protein [Flavobacteriaceae bacterium]